MLTVNGIQVISAQRRGTVSKSSSAGLFCGSVQPVKVENFIVTPELPHAFVVMPFAAPYTDVYLDVIKSVCTEFGITAIRADEIYGPGVIVQDIVDQVVNAQLVIADISVANAMSTSRWDMLWPPKSPSFFLAKKDTALPFDVSGFRVLFYEDSIGGKAKVEDGLRKHLTTLVGQRQLGFDRRCGAPSPKWKVGLAGDISWGSVGGSRLRCPASRTGLSRGRTARKP